MTPLRSADPGLVFYTISRCQTPPLSPLLYLTESFVPNSTRAGPPSLRSACHRPALTVLFPRFRKPRRYGPPSSGEHRLGYIRALQNGTRIRSALALISSSLRVLGSVLGCLQKVAHLAGRGLALKRLRVRVIPVRRVACRCWACLLSCSLNGPQALGSFISQPPNSGQSAVSFTITSSTPFWCRPSAFNSRPVLARSAAIHVPGLPPVAAMDEPAAGSILLRPSAPIPSGSRAPLIRFEPRAILALDRPRIFYGVQTFALLPPAIESRIHEW